MGISIGVGTFSGIDYTEIITKLMEIERLPITQLQEKKEEYETKISALGEISSAVTELRTSLDNLKTSSLSSASASSTSQSAYSVSTSNANVVSASAQSGATAGEFDITVLALAQSLKLHSQDYSTDKTVFNSGTISLNVNGTVTNVNIDYSNSTLAGIKDAINSSGAAVNASIIHGDSGYRMVITSDTGEDGNLTITTSDNTSAANSLSAFSTGSMAIFQSAQNSVAIIDGVYVTSSSNTLTDAISGLTLNLNSVSSSAVKVKVAFDSDIATTNVQDFIDKYNALTSTVNGFLGKDGDLGFDATVKSIITTMRSITTTTYGSDTMAEYGFSHDRNGVLSLDTSKLEKAIINGEKGFTSLLNSMANSFDDDLKDIINVLLVGREDTFEDRVDDLQDSIDLKEYTLQLKEEAYIKKFTMLEQTISQLQQTGNSLSESLANLGKQV